MCTAMGLLTIFEGRHQMTSRRSDILAMTRRNNVWIVGLVNVDHIDQTLGKVGQDEHVFGIPSHSRSRLSTDSSDNRKPPTSNTLTGIHESFRLPHWPQRVDGVSVYWHAMVGIISPPTATASLTAVRTQCMQGLLEAAVLSLRVEKSRADMVTKN